MHSAAKQDNNTCCCCANIAQACCYHAAAAWLTKCCCKYARTDNALMSRHTKTNKMHSLWPLQPEKSARHTPVATST